MVNTYYDAARRMLAIALGALMVVAVAPGQASAYSWGTLTVYESGVGQGQGYGTWVMSSGNLSNADGYLRDLKPTGESIYYKVYTYSSNCTYACSGRRTASEYKESTRWNGDYWRQWSADVTVDPDFGTETSRFFVCEDQALSPDDCSSQDWAGPYSF